MIREDHELRDALLVCAGVLFGLAASIALTGGLLYLAVKLVRMAWNE